MSAAVDTEDLTREHLAQLLRDAEREHADYERELGQRDEHWPEWYAGYVLDRLREVSTS